MMCYHVPTVNVNMLDPYGNGPLHNLSFGGGGPSTTDKRMIRILVAFGADVNLKNKLGQTPLLFAEEWKDQGLLEILRNHVHVKAFRTLVAGVNSPRSTGKPISRLIPELMERLLEFLL